MSDNKHIDLRFQVRRRNLPYHQQVANLALKYSAPGDTILDIGTGAGSIPYMLNGRGRSIDIADAYQECLDTAAGRAEVREAHLIDEASFDVTRRIPHRDYAVVTMSHVLEHIANPVQAVRDALTLVRPGGHLILAVPNPVRPVVIIASIFRRRHVNKGHVVAWDRSHWMNFLENILELDVREYSSDFVQILPRHHIGFLTRLEVGLAKLLPWLSFSHIAVVAKRERIGERAPYGDD